jgi:hypothetical protein
MQQTRIVSIDAQNAQHAKVLAEADVSGVGDAEKIIVQETTQTATDVGAASNGTPLHRYDVTVKIIRQIIVDAEDYADADKWADEDAANYTDSTEVRSHRVVKMLREKTGVA